MKKTAWVLILILAAIAITQYVTYRNARTVADTSLSLKQDTINKIMADYSDYRVWADSALNNATATAIQNGEIAEQARAELNKTRDQVTDLLLKLENAEKEPKNSTWVEVSPNYKDGCDSLRRLNAKQNGLIDQYEQDNQAHVNSLAYETQVRDSALQKERLFNSVFKAQLVNCMTQLNAMQKSNAGKTQLYAGMAAWGSRVSLLGGGEINLGIKTRTDQFYEIKGAYIGQWWLGIGTKFKLSF